MTDTNAQTPDPAKQPAQALKPMPSLDPTRLLLAEQRRNVWHVYVPPGEHPEQLLPADRWAHLARSLKQGDRIEAESEDGTWLAELLVRDSGSNWAKVHILRAYRLDTAAPERRSTILAGHSVKWGGPRVKYRVIRDSDQKVLRERCTTEGEAYAWLSEYARTLSN